MQVEDPNPRGALGEDALHAFERKLGVRLPEPYRAYLLRFNGGRWSRQIFSISPEDGESRVHQVYGLHAGPDYSRLDAVRTVFADRIPSDLLAFAADAFGNQLCIGIKGKRTGQVFFWDHEVEGGKGLVVLQDSFDGFVNALQEYVPADELERIIRADDVAALQALLDGGTLALEAADKNGDTLLENAAIRGGPGVIRFLFERGAELKNALAYAEKNARYFKKHQPIVALLKELWGRT